MRRYIRRATQQINTDMNWSTAILLILLFLVPVSAEEAAKESEQADPNEPQKYIRGYKVDTSRTDEEGNFVRTAVYGDEPNDVPYVPRSTAGTPTSPAIEAGLQRINVDIGPEVYNFTYEESGIEEEGLMYGVRFGFTVHDIVPEVPMGFKSDRGMMFRAEGRFAFGQVDYDGQLLDGTPYKINNIDDYTFEGRFLLGVDLLSGEALNTFYAGLGYRYLNDDPSFDPAAYERESRYLYVPVGYSFDSSHKPGWSFGFGAEFDIFISGNQKSHLEDFDPIFPTIDNDQNDGYGYRASVRLRHKSKDAIIVIEPFYRFWDIDDSEIEFGFYEPDNETTEFGIQLYWLF